MDLKRVLGQVDARTAQAFVRASRNVFDALMLEAERVQEAGTPPPRDYAAAGLSREAPAGGWLTHAELRETARKLTESIAAEKWLEGMCFAVRALSALGAV